MGELALKSAFQVRVECLRVLCSIAETCTDVQLCVVLEMTQAMDVYVNALNLWMDPASLMLALRTLKALFERTHQIMDLPFMEMFTERQGLERLHHLHDHPSQEMHLLAADILDSFLGAEDEELL